METQRGDVFFTPELIRASDAQLNDKIRESVKRLREEVATNESMKVARLVELARPMVQAAPTLTNLGILEELLHKGDNAAMFAVATILRVRRDPAFMARLIDHLDPKLLRNDTLWRILRAIRDTLPSYTITPHGRMHLVNRIKRLTSAQRRPTRDKIGPDHILGKCVEILRKVRADPADILTDRQLAIFKSIDTSRRTPRILDAYESPKGRRRARASPQESVGSRATAGATHENAVRARAESEHLVNRSTTTVRHHADPPAPKPSSTT
jgi:hypothetical protein